MAEVDLKLADADLLDRLRLVSEAFRPAAPVDRRSLFAGRGEQIADVFSVVAQPGQHAVIYGERGVGKTSLASVSAELLTGANVLTARATCDVSDDFGSVWRKALDEIVLHSTTQAIGFAESVERYESNCLPSFSGSSRSRPTWSGERWIESLATASLRSSSTSSIDSATPRVESCSRTRSRRSRIVLSVPPCFSSGSRIVSAS